MLVKALLGELQFEADNTRKLFNAISDDVLDYRPNDFNWTLGQLASHIAEIYNWWPHTMNTPEVDLAAYSYDKGDISSMKHIKIKLEQNIDLAIQSIIDYPEENLMGTWTLKNGDHIVFGPLPRVQAIRGFLMNHLYHHRGEMIAYLRTNELPVPGLYGPSYEEQMAMIQAI